MGQTVSGLFYDNTPETFSKDELQFVDPVPDHLELECPICLQIMWDPYILSCCGHHFCWDCIKKARNSSNFCPLCKRQGYDTMCDKGLQRAINSLAVKCANCHKGCPWEGQLGDLPAHTNRKTREGECTLAVVSCKNGCGHEDERWRLGSIHESNECLKRPYQCSYCDYHGIYNEVTGTHLNRCIEYPIGCPNNCGGGVTLPRKRMKAHLTSECPLTDLKCDYRWAGCMWVGFRKDLEVHVDRSVNEHLLLVAKVTVSVQEENKSLKSEVEKLKTLLRKTSNELKQQSSEVNSLKLEIRQLKTRT